MNENSVHDLLEEAILARLESKEDPQFRWSRFAAADVAATAVMESKPWLSLVSGSLRTLRAEAEVVKLRAALAEIKSLATPWAHATPNDEAAFEVWSAERDLQEAGRSVLAVLDRHGVTAQSDTEEPHGSD